MKQEKRGEPCQLGVRGAVSLTAGKAKVACDASLPDWPVRVPTPHCGTTPTGQDGPPRCRAPLGRKPVLAPADCVGGRPLAFQEQCFGLCARIPCAAK